MTQVLGIPEKIANFKENWPKAKSYYYEVFYQTPRWSGIFDSFPEGVVDMADYGLTEENKAAVDLVVEGNWVNGTIWWDQSCNLGLPWSGILIQGYINFGGKSAEMEIFDFVGGHKVTFMTGTFRVDDQILEMSDFPVETDLNGSRLFHNPDPATIEDWPSNYCSDFMFKGQVSDSLKQDYP
ncbi:hypothetical protein [Thioclava sp. F28-4]|uniref:hypothetical protein n=1 Tax=Thioclava sp. F28-4 TaxID=1915315 RepID=UPI0011BA6C9B|nr:hypothetical protein [Thioclava sp. F28-4]